MECVSQAGFILAGGRSSRMGSDKALADFAGRPLIANAVRTLAAVGIPASIAGSRSSLAAYAEEVQDTYANAGPLGGVHAALASSRADWNLFLPVDLPLLPSSLLRSLLQRGLLTGAPITAVRLNGRLEPFPVVLDRRVLPFIAQRLAASERACHTAWQSIPAELGSVLDAVQVENLLQCGQCSHPLGLPPLLWFQSANTLADLARLNQVVSGQIVSGQIVSGQIVSGASPHQVI